jgi:hypothetical protein
VNASLHHDHNKSKHAVSLAFALDELCLLEEWKKAAAVLVRNTDLKRQIASLYDGLGWHMPQTKSSPRGHHFV